MLTLAWFGIAGLGGCAGILNDPNMIRVSSPHVGFNDARQLTRNGVNAFQRGEVESAVASFNQAIRVDESYGPAHNNLGRVYFQQGELKRAADAFSWAMEFMPGRPEPINNLGLILESTGKIDEAIELYQSAHATMPDEPEYLANLVRARIRRGDRGADVRGELQSLKFIENRSEWSLWVDENLALLRHGETNLNGAPSSGETMFPSARERVSSSLPTFNDTPIQTSVGPELVSPENDALYAPPDVSELFSN